MTADYVTGRGAFDEYASSLWEHLKDNRVLIIIPFYTNYPILFKHLELLSKQTTSDFDALIVASSVSDEKKVLGFIGKNKFAFGTVVVKRKEDTGSAGGYFTGEKYALEKGYRAIIIGDDDCLPEDRNLIEKLIGGWKDGSLAVGPECRFLMDEMVLYISRALPFYNLIDMSVLKRGGLHYLPAYMGAEDWEFVLRISKGLKVAQIDAIVTHPARHSIFVNFDRSLLYRINQMLLTIPECFVEYMYGFAIMCPIYLIFGSRKARRGGAHILKSVMMHRFGKRSLLEEVAEKEEPTRSFDAVVSPTRNEKTTFLYDYSEIRGGFRKLPGFAASVARKVVLLDLINNVPVLISMMIAKETWIASSKGTYLLARNSGIAQNLAKICLFALTFPFFLAGGFLTYLLNCLRKPDTRRYGLR